MDKNTKTFLWIFFILVIAFGILFSLRLFNPEKPLLNDKLSTPIEDETATEYSYSGFNFIKEGGFWYTQIKKLGSNDLITLELRFDPKTLEEVPVEGNPNEFLLGPDGNLIEGAYLTFDPLGTDLTAVALASAQVSTVMAKIFEVTPIAACTVNETNACLQRPIISCPNDQFYTLHFVEDEETKIVSNGNCLELHGSAEGLLKTVDRLLLIWLGIMKA
jgi:hypothetical protein